MYTTLDDDCDEEPPADCKCENLKFANHDCKLEFIFLVSFDCKCEICLDCFNPYLSALDLRHSLVWNIKFDKNDFSPV